MDGLKTAITDAVTKRLDAAVTAGKITKEQEAKLLEGLTAHLDDFVNGVHKAARLRPRALEGRRERPAAGSGRPARSRPGVVDSRAGRCLS